VALWNHWRQGDERVVLTATQIAAFVGVALAGAAYVPQIWHLVRVHCSAGISRFAFCGWLGASLLVTTHAVVTRAVVFILLGGVQIVATTVVLVYATKYSSSHCLGHAPVDFGAETNGSTSIDKGAVSRLTRVMASSDGTGRTLTRAGEQPEGGPGVSSDTRSPR
jgi:PQ loop repeat